MSQFVVIYDRVLGVSTIQQFDGEDAAERALEARFSAESGAGPNVEIASLTAANLNDLKVTHSRYFRSAEEVFGDFEKLLAS
ncbi:MAG: hypothetical protein V4479_01730 [Actinomycetota bacterium]